ncbi:MAG: hypothetical protein WBB29_11870 [Geitlerinemataceae cyanobacterium]
MLLFAIARSQTSPIETDNNSLAGDWLNGDGSPSGSCIQQF